MQKMAKNISHSQKDKNDISANFTQNILIENELNAIGKLPYDLANRAMILLEKTTEHKMEIDNKIIDLEQGNQQITKDEMNEFYFWSGFGVVCTYLIIFCSIFACIFLAYNDQTMTAIIGIIPGILTSATQLLKMFRFKPQK